MPRGAFTAGRSPRFDDAKIASNDGSYQDAEGLVAPQRFTPQAVMVGYSSDADEEAAGYARIDGFLVGENATFRKVHRLVTKILVGKAFRRVYNTANTTAREIDALEEV